MTTIQQLNGKALEQEDTVKLLSLNTGHFTSMQVRKGKIQGLSLDMNRLLKSSMILFGYSHDEEKIKDSIKKAITGIEDCSLRINIFVNSAEPSNLSDNDLQVLVTVTDAAAPNQQALKVSLLLSKDFSRSLSTRALR